MVHGAHRGVVTLALGKDTRFSTAVGGSPRPPTVAYKMAPVQSAPASGLSTPHTLIIIVLVEGAGDDIDVHQYLTTTAG